MADRRRGEQDSKRHHRREPGGARAGLVSGKPPARFDFGVVQVGRLREMPIRVRNSRVFGTDRSAQPVSVTTTQPDGGSNFVLSVDGCKAVLHPGDSCFLKVAFEPTDARDPGAAWTRITGGHR
jgi:hypothetical protein